MRIEHAQYTMNGKIGKERTRIMQIIEIPFDFFASTLLDRFLGKWKQ